MKIISFYLKTYTLLYRRGTFFLDGNHIKSRFYLFIYIFLTLYVFQIDLDSYFLIATLTLATWKAIMPTWILLGRSHVHHITNCFSWKWLEGSIYQSKKQKASYISYLARVYLKIHSFIFNLYISWFFKGFKPQWR